MRWASSLFEFSSLLFETIEKPPLLSTVPIPRASGYVYSRYSKNFSHKMKVKLNYNYKEIRNTKQKLSSIYYFLLICMSMIDQNKSIVTVVGGE